MESNKQKDEKKEKKTIKTWFKGMKEKFNDFATFCAENPQVPMMIGSGLFTAVFGGMKLLSGIGDAKMEKCAVPDEVTGLNFYTKKPLTNEEKLELGERVIDGEWAPKALEEMGLLR